MLDVQTHTTEDWQWKTEGDVTVCGEAFDEGEYVGSELHHVFDDIDDVQTLSETLLNLNGLFATIVDRDDVVYAAVDRICSIPLFYSVTDDTIYISDDPRWIRRYLPDEPCDEDAATEFLLTSYVTGSDTLYPSIKQL